LTTCSNNLYINLGGESALIKDKEPILATIYRAAAAAGLTPVDTTTQFEMVRGFENLQNFILERPGKWVINDSISLHLFPDGFPFEHVQISRDYEWACTLPGPRCIGVHTHSMLASPQGAIELLASLHSKPIEPIEGFRSIHVVNEFAPSDNETICRNALAAVSWGKLALLDIHYKFVFFEQQSVPYVWDIFSQIDEFAEDGDLCIFTNRDICLVPEATAIMRSFMTNHGLKTAYASRVDILNFETADHKDLFSERQYGGIDLFCWVKGNLPKVSPVHKQLIVGYESWDAVFRILFGGSNHKIPYSICYHYAHDPKWQSKEGADGNYHNKLLSSLVNQNVPITFSSNGIPYYESDKF